MESENFNSFENNYSNTSRKNIFLSNIFDSLKEHKNLAKDNYDINNGLNCISKQDIENFFNKDLSTTRDMHNSSLCIFFEDNDQSLSIEELDFFGINRNHRIKNSSKENDANIKDFNHIIPSKDEKIKSNHLKYFSVIYPEKDSLFRRRSYERDFLLKKRFEKKRTLPFKKKAKLKKRKNRRDIIRRMIARKFLNGYIINNLNNILKSVKSKIYFEKFEIHFSYDLGKKENKSLLNKTLEEIFIANELYRGTKLDKFRHNKQEIMKLKTEEHKDIIKDTKIDIILKSKICDLFKEYLSSDNFQKEIHALENSSRNYEKAYIEKYKQYAMNFIEYSKE